MCPRLVSTQITGSTSLSIRDNGQQAGRPSSLAETACQIQLLTDPYRIIRKTPACHQPTFGPSSYPGVPSAAVAIADSRQSMFIHSVQQHNGTQNRIREKRTAIRCARGADGELSEGTSAVHSFIRLRFIPHHAILGPEDLKWNSASLKQQAAQRRIYREITKRLYDAPDALYLAKKYQT